MEKFNDKKLEEILKDVKEVGILAHYNPDPDCISSTLGIQLWLEKQFGIKSEIFYDGQINDPENKSLVNLTAIELNHIDSFDKEKYKNDVILVDFAKSDLVENPLIVIDHHDPGKNKIKAQFKYIKEVGACITLVLDLFSHYEIKLDKQKHHHIITAMAHGLRSDTNKLLIDVTQEDLDAYLSLHHLIDYDTLIKIEHPPKKPSTIEVMSKAMRKENQVIKDNYLISGVGIVEESDGIFRAADFLVDRQGINTTIIYGVVDGKIIASVRAKDPSSITAPELAKAIFGDEYAGGRGKSITKAGARVPIDYFKSKPDDSSDYKDHLWRTVKERTMDNFYKAIKTEKDDK